MRFDLFTLQLLLTVCDEKSIARAADRENIAAHEYCKYLIYLIYFRNFSESSNRG